MPEVPPAAAPPVPEPAAGAEAAPEPVAELGAGVTAALELGELEGALDAGVLVVVLAVVGVVGLVAVVGVAASADVGIVSAGASALSTAGWELPPHPARANTTRATSPRALNRVVAVGPLRIPGL